VADGPWRISPRTGVFVLGGRWEAVLRLVIRTSKA
jgi:hypothetical protein